MIRLPHWKKYLEKLTITASPKLKGVVLLLTLTFIGAFFLVNWFFINTLSQQYREVTDKEADLYRRIILQNIQGAQFDWAFDEVLLKSKFPMIITDKHKMPFQWKNLPRSWWGPDMKRLNSRISWGVLTNDERSHIKKLLSKMDEKREPLELEISAEHFYGEKQLLYLHYGDIEIVQYLAWMPLLEFLVLSLVFLIGYFGYITIRSNEQSILWVALAKETAHQMGTPLSSLMGWIELLKFHMSKSSVTNPKDIEIIQAIEGDLSRLNRVSIRFSQIGSLPKLIKQPLNTLVEDTAEYFSDRLPQLGKKVDLQLKLRETPDIWMNAELLGWVLENLIKNALDSLHHKTGSIKIETFYAKVDKMIQITITDTGKGIEKENWKKIFETGFSTKKRGWGLGLSLAKRIITIYHSGDIIVEWSSPWKGTQFLITLPILPEIAKREINDK